MYLGNVSGLFDAVTTKAMDVLKDKLQRIQATLQSKVGQFLILKEKLYLIKDKATPYLKHADEKVRKYAETIMTELTSLMTSQNRLEQVSMEVITEGNKWYNQLNIVISKESGTRVLEVAKNNIVNATNYIVKVGKLITEADEHIIKVNKLDKASDGLYNYSQSGKISEALGSVGKGIERTGKLAVMVAGAVAVIYLAPTIFKKIRKKI